MSGGTRLYEIVLVHGGWKFAGILYGFVDVLRPSCVCGQLYLGVYESELEAAKAHDRAARFHFPDKAMTNFNSEEDADRLMESEEV